MAPATPKCSPCCSSPVLPTQSLSLEGLVAAAQCGQKPCSLRGSFLLYSKGAFKRFLLLLGGGGGRCNLQAISLFYYTFFRSPAATGTPGAGCPSWAPAPSLVATDSENFCVIAAFLPPRKAPQGDGGVETGCFIPGDAGQAAPSTSASLRFHIPNLSAGMSQLKHSASCAINCGRVFKHREEPCTCFPMRVEPVLSNIIYRFIHIYPHPCGQKPLLAHSCLPSRHPAFPKPL